MKTQIVEVTPWLARDMLKHNDKNRPLRPAHVETLRASFERGEYVMTHQGIAFDDDGTLVDGQHRLSAIALLPDTYSFPMLVTRGMDRGAAFPVIDAVQAKRSTSDVLSIDSGLGYLGNFLAKLYAGRGNSITPTYVEPFAMWARREYEDLTQFCGSVCKTWSSAPVRAAAIIAMKVGHDSDYVKLVYSSLVRAEFNSMPPAIQSLYRSHMSGKVKASASYDIFCRCLKVFDPKNAKLTKIQINDPLAAIASVRDMMDQEIFRAKKKAPAMCAGARRSVAASNYTLAGL